MEAEDISLIIVPLSIMYHSLAKKKIWQANASTLWIFNSYYS
jgi:hypothetical protein